jgi:serine/threonine protein kinase
MQYRTCFVQSYGWFQSEHAIHIAMEFFEHGDLQSHLSIISQTLSEHQVRQITFQLLEGLQFMHDNGFVHRDLKPSVSRTCPSSRGRVEISTNWLPPQNILIRYPGPDWWVKIGDFGISKRAIEGLTACRTFTGTLGFLAPEILARQGLIDTDVYSGMKEYTSAVDIWSLGEIMYRCLTGSSTFASPAKVARFTSGKLPLPLDKLRSEWEITDEGCQFLGRVFEIQPKHRMSASEALGHPWLVSLSEVSPRSSEEITG